MFETSQVDYEKALSVTGFSRHNVRRFLLCGSIIVAQVCEVLSMIYLTPASACEFQTTSKQQRFMTSMPIPVACLSGHLVGYLADTRGRRKVLIKCMILGFIVAVTAAFSTNWIMLAVLKFIGAAFMGVVHLLSQVLLSECTPKAKRNVMVMLSTSIFLITLGLMSVIAIPILSLKMSFYIPILDITFNSWRLLSLIYSIPTVVSAFAITRVSESPQYLLSMGKHEEAVETLRCMYVKNTGKTPDSYNIKTLLLNEDGLTKESKGFFKSVLARTLPIFKPPYRKYHHLLSWLFTGYFVCSMVLVMWLTYIANVFVTSLQNGDTTLNLCAMINKYENLTATDLEVVDCSINASALTVVFGGAIILAVLNIICTGLVTYIGRKNLLIAIQVISGISLLGIRMSWHWQLTAVLFLLYLIGIINFGIIMSYDFDIFPTYIRSSSICLNVLIGYVNGQMTFLLVMTLLNNHCDIIFYIFGTLACLGGLLGLLLPSDEKILELKKRPIDTET